MNTITLTLCASTRTGCLSGPIPSCADERLTLAGDLTLSAGTSVALLTPRGNTLAHTILSEECAPGATIPLSTLTAQAAEYTRSCRAGDTREALLAIGDSEHPIALIPARIAQNPLYTLAPPTTLAPAYPTSETLHALLSEVQAAALRAENAQASATSAQAKAETAQGSAQASASAAYDSAKVASASEQAATSAKNAAEAAQTKSKASEAAAKTSETAASASEKAAKASERAAASSAAAAGDSAVDAEDSATAADGSKRAAEAAQGKAEAAQSAAEAAQGAAQGAATSAGESAELAAERLALVPAIAVDAEAALAASRELLGTAPATLVELSAAL